MQVGGQRSIISLNDVSHRPRRTLWKDHRFTMTMNKSDGSTGTLPQRTKVAHNRWLHPRLAHPHRQILQRLVACPRLLSLEVCLHLLLLEVCLHLPSLEVCPRLLSLEVCRGLLRLDPQVGPQLAVVPERNMWTFSTHRKNRRFKSNTLCNRSDIL